MRIMVPATAMRYIPAPMAMPMPAVVQMPAAVVRPVTQRLRSKIMPAPRKPMPATTLDATRETSALKNSVRGETSKKPYLETSIIRAAPMQTMRWVRMPASFRRLVRSMPMHRPQQEARISRTAQTI